MESKEASIWTKLAYIVPCHRKISRCFHVNGKPMPICARCLSILLGYLWLPILLLLPFPIPWWLGFILQIPMLIDGFTQLQELRESTNRLRCLTGLLSGIGLSILVVYFIRFLLEMVL
ncbi:putative membrane protein [Croceifilum oryzae]|uniref:Membrane protein n=1 Tax=Croceifilum oryzae TaxID=1553429 RepID=A0AAJ1TL99_9BACL|nr:DUF2085 domain-containing protein [Croceifilum oryzae]MDQ0416761.1 putative membrane protein [Croceifilum oryzae]